MFWDMRESCQGYEGIFQQLSLQDCIHDSTWVFTDLVVTAFAWICLSLVEGFSQWVSEFSFGSERRSSFRENRTKSKPCRLMTTLHAKCFWCASCPRDGIKWRIPEFRNHNISRSLLKWNIIILLNYCTSTVRAPVSARITTSHLFGWRIQVAGEATGVCLFYSAFLPAANYWKHFNRVFQRF